MTHGVARCLELLGEIAERQKEWARAGAFYAESLHYRSIGGDRISLTLCLERAAHMALALGNTIGAIRVLGAAEALRETHGSSPSLQERSEIERTIENSRSALGEAAFVAAWAVGRALSLEVAVKEALESVNSPATRL